MARNPDKKPDAVYQTITPSDYVALDPIALDSLVTNNGVQMLHFQAIPCPVGLADPTDIRRTHEDHSGCSNGFLYIPAGRVTCMFTSNSADIAKLDGGFADGSTVMVTFPRFYSCDPKKRVMVRPYDRLYLEDEALTVGTNLFKRRTDGRPDKLSYPAVQVDHLVDSSGVAYLQGMDFDLIGGDLVWRPGHGPAQGTVYSCRYQYRAYWYVDRLVHEIRVCSTRDYMDTNNIHTERINFSAVLKREWVHRDSPNDPSIMDLGGRQAQVPDTLVVEPGTDPTFG